MLRRSSKYRDVKLDALITSDWLSLERFFLKSLSYRGSAVAWWLLSRTPDQEVGGSSPTRVKPCCVLEQGTFTPQKYW